MRSQNTLTISILHVKILWLNEIRFCFDKKETPDSDQDEICLEYYCRVWTEFRRSSKVLNGAAAYLNKQHHKKDADAESIEQIALHTWRDHLFTHLNEKVANAALRMLERSRGGSEINSNAIRAIVESYIELGVLDSSSDSDSTTAHLTVGFFFFATLSSVFSSTFSLNKYKFEMFFQIQS